MSVSEAPYLLFLAGAVALYAWAARGRTRAPASVLVALACVFYGSGNPLFLLPLAVTVTVDHLVGRALGRCEAPGRRRAWLALSLLVDLSLLGTLKCWDLVADAWWRVQGGRPPSISLVLYAGVSFYTFQSLGYVIDVYRRLQAPVERWLDYAAFVTFFPSLLAGPISRAQDLVPQIQGRPRPMHEELAARGFLLLALGFVKKCLIADYLGVQLASRVFEQPRFYSSLEVAAGLYAYAVQIYCDFSGYTDIALGAALLLGFELKGNFRSPYRSSSLAEFWQRWHITFSTWLRDYVFFSLPGNRRGRRAPYVNVVITFALGGLWHGVSLGFLAWGLIHGLGLAFERWVEPRGFPARAPAWRRALRTALTFHVVLVAWVFFRAESLETAGQIFRRLGDLTLGAGNIPGLAVAVIVLVLAAQWVPDEWQERRLAGFARWPAPLQAAALGAVAVAVRLAAGARLAPFIYQGF